MERIGARCRVPARGAVVGNDISGFGDPDYLVSRRKHDATVVATTSAPSAVADSDPRYDDLVVTSRVSVREAGAPRPSGSGPEQIVLDAGSISARARRRARCS